VESGQSWVDDEMDADFDAETSSVSSVFIAQGYLRSNAQNRHPFHHLPKVECITKSSQQSFVIDGKICITI